MARTIARPEVTVASARADRGNSTLSSRGVMSERKLETLRSWVLVVGDRCPPQRVGRGEGAISFRIDSARAASQSSSMSFWVSNPSKRTIPS